MKMIVIPNIQVADEWVATAVLMFYLSPLCSSSHKTSYDITSAEIAH